MAKIPKNWGLYRPNRKLAVRLIWQPDRLAVDRPGRPPTVRNMIVGANRSTARPTAEIQRVGLSDPVDRPVDRPDTESKALWSGRPTGPVSARRAQGCARRSTVTVDRPLVRSTRAVDRPGLSATVWVRNWVRKTVKHISKNSFKSCKSPQK